MLEEKIQIGDELRSSTTVDTITSPFDGSPVGTVAVGSSQDLEDAMAAATRAFDVMRRLPAHRRADILEAVAAKLAERSEELAVLMAREGGKPIRYGRGEVTRAVLTMKLGAGEARRLGGEVLPVDLEPRAEGRLALSVRVPRGPVAAISPFNFPLNLIAHKLSPAVAAGASTVLKPPPQCPLTGHVLGRIFSEAGLPDGGLSVVHCPPEVAQAMVEDERMKVLSFTGSDVVGWRLKSLAGKKQVLLELGGNAPCIVGADADLDDAMPRIVAGAWAQSGQVCIKVQRIIVEQSRFDEVLERFIAATRDVQCGDPMNEDTVVGPLIEPVHVDRVLSWVKEAVAAGATMHCGGEADGSIVKPTVLTGVAHDQRVCRDEVFGPVTVLEPCRSLEHGFELANASRFGLQAGVFTRDLGKAMAAFRDLDYGGVMINDVPTFRVDNFPYGGVKDSGFGREGVRYAIEEMTEPKVLILR